jgi:hypothetical protein
VKPIAVVLIMIAVLSAAAGLYLAALAHALHRTRAAQIAKLGFGRESARLYRQAAALLNQLEASSSDLDALMTGDILSPETRKKVTAWVADCRKDTGK